MNAKGKLEIICRRTADSYRRVYGDKIRAIFLYGSYARGDFNEESDIDFAAIVEGEREDLQQKCRLELKDTLAMDLEYDTVISPNVIPADEFARYEEKLPYYRNIKTEGKLLD